jgi:hypothetical protein
VSIKKVCVIEDKEAGFRVENEEELMRRQVHCEYMVMGMGRNTHVENNVVLQGRHGVCSRLGRKITSILNKRE